MDLSERRRQALADVYEVVTSTGDPQELLDAIYERVQHPALRYSDSDPPQGAVDPYENSTTDAAIRERPGAVGRAEALAAVENAMARRRPEVGPHTRRALAEAALGAMMNFPK